MVLQLCSLSFAVSACSHSQAFALLKYYRPTVHGLLAQGSQDNRAQKAVSFFCSLTAAPANQLICMLPSQVFHCHFNSNFFPLFLEHLLSDQISVSTGSFLLGESQVGLEGAARLGLGSSLGLLFPNSHEVLWAVRLTHAHVPHASLRPLSCPS